MEYLWAPARYRWTDLLNSDSHDYRGSGRREDRIWNDDWLAQFLARCGYADSRLPGQEERQRLERLRSDMARIVAAVLAGKAPSEPELRAFDHHLRLAESRPVLDFREGGYQVSVLSSREGLDAIMGEVARTLADTLAHGELDRIKTCANPDCGWIMYDESRNRTRRWCEVSACGNLVKVREFRERQGASRARVAGASGASPTARRRRARTADREEEER